MLTAGSCPWVLALLLLQVGYRKAEPAPEEPTRAAVGRCQSIQFEGSPFTVCPSAGLQLELAVAGRDGRAYRSFAALEHVLGRRAGKVVFAMNAGMFDEIGTPIGLAVVDGRELARRTGATGAVIST